MKKFKMFFVIILASLGLSLNSFAYNGNVTVSTSLVNFTDANLICAWSVTGGVHFTHVGDSVSLFFEIKDMTTGQILGSQYINHVTTPGDSINLGIVYTVYNLISGHQYKISPHFVLYQDGSFVWFTNGVDLFFTTNCNNPTVAVTGGGTICAGTSTTLTASGATDYTWSPSAGLSSTTGASVIASPIVTTTYTVTGLVGICSSTATSTITVAGAMSPTISSSVTICSGQSTQIIAGGATTYQWSPAAGLSNANIANPIATPTATTTYTVTLSNGSCTATESVTVTVAPAIILSVSSVDPEICIGGSAQLNASGGTTYQWSPAISLNNANISNPTASPLSTTTYFVTVSNGSCTATGSTTINVDSLPAVTSASFSSGTLILNGNFPGTISFININGINYYPFVGNTIQALFQGVSINPSDFIFVQTVSSSCFTTFQYFATGVDEENENAVCIKLNDQISLFSVTGQIIEKINSPRDFTKSEFSKIKNLFLTDLPVGVYFFKSGKVTEKFMLIK